jgi:hypothetical protein
MTGSPVETAGMIGRISSRGLGAELLRLTAGTLAILAIIAGMAVLSLAAVMLLQLPVG